jgi:hypothetical protein
MGVAWPPGLVVAEPPQWPKGVAGPPPVKEKKKREGGRSTHRGLAGHPVKKEEKKNVKEEEEQ